MNIALHVVEISIIVYLLLALRTLNQVLRLVLEGNKFRDQSIHLIKNSLGERSP